MQCVNNQWGRFFPLLFPSLPLSDFKEPEHVSNMFQTRFVCVRDPPSGHPPHTQRGFGREEGRAAS